MEMGSAGTLSFTLSSAVGTGLAVGLGSPLALFPLYAAVLSRCPVAPLTNSSLLPWILASKPNNLLDLVLIYEGREEHWAPLLGHLGESLLLLSLSLVASLKSLMTLRHQLLFESEAIEW